LIQHTKYTLYVKDMIVMNEWSEDSTNNSNSRMSIFKSVLLQLPTTALKTE